MGNRFGRNKRRRMREAIAEAEAKRDQAEAEARRYAGLLRARNTAETEAVNAILRRREFYEEVIKRLAHSAGAEAGRWIAPEVEKAISDTLRLGGAMMQAQVRNRTVGAEDYGRRVVSLHVPSITWNMALDTRDLEARRV